ncbi:Ig-like domain-containing protein [Candidatus Neomarinimicrobiota bacterium]
MYRFPSSLPRSISSLLLLCLVGFSLWQCAAEGGPPGGPVDLEGPHIVEVEPPSGFTQLTSRQEIEITFNEPVDPVSVPGSIVLNPELDITTRVRGRRIMIRPEESYDAGVVYTVTFQRGIRDYQKNSIPQSFQLVFSTGGEIPEGVINGHVSEYDPKVPMTAGLFRHPDTSRSYQPERNMDLAADGSFSFEYLQDGSYRVVVVDGKLTNFPDLLYRQSYAMLTLDSVIVQSDTASITLHRSPPLSQPQMRSLDWLTPNFLSIAFDGPFGEAPLPENLYPTREAAVYNYILPAGMIRADSIVVNPGQAFNQLGEPYNLKPLRVLTPVLIDTIPPSHTLVQNNLLLNPVSLDAGGDFGAAEGRITFSEPIEIPEAFSAELAGQDTTDVSIFQIDPLTLQFRVAKPDLYNKLIILGHDILDEAGNPMADSLLALNVAFSIPGATGRIRGAIHGFSGQLVVQALSRETGQRIAYTITDSTRYFIDDVPPGFYTIFAHEYMGDRPVPYYGGRWEPFHRAARFAYHNSDVEVRPRWEVDGIDINFKDGIFGISQP